MNKPTYKILIAEDDTYASKGIEAILNDLEFATEIHQVKNGSEAIRFLEKNKIDVLVTDVNMQPVNGIELCQHVKKNYMHIKIIVLTGFVTMEYVNPLSELGVGAIIYKNNASTADLFNAFSIVMLGGTFVSPIFSKFKKDMNALTSMAQPPLTDVERQIVQLLAVGEKIQNIAFVISKSKRTTERMIENLKIQYNVQNNTALVKKAMDLKLI